MMPASLNEKAQGQEEEMPDISLRITLCLIRDTIEIIASTQHNL